MNRKLILLGACAAVAAAAYVAFQSNSSPDISAAGDASGKALVSINVPPVKGNAAVGKRVFESACISCHGQDATGVDGSGPPLIHKIYEPGHHSDESFQRAVSTGVRSHHWRFGDMPPVEGMTRGDVKMVIAYIREIQRANGIN